MGTVTSSSSSYRGGFIGYHSGGTLTSCGYYSSCGVTGAVNGSTNSNVTAYSTSELTSKTAGLDEIKYTSVSSSTALLTALKAGENVKLTKSFSLSNWSDISDYAGILDGNGYTLSNLSHTEGLFVSIKNATIKNLTLSGFTISDSDSNTGALAGTATNSEIDNVKVTGGTVTGYSSGSYTGGLVGYSSGTKITNSSSSATVSGYQNTGGLVGYNYSNSVIINSSATGSVTGSGTYTGGLVGQNSSTIQNSYATGTVTGKEDYIGGFAGYNSGTITKSYASGTVKQSSSSYDYTGGFVGYNSSGTIKDSYASGSVSGYQYTGGFAGYQSYGTITNCYSSGAVSSTYRYTGGFVGYKKYGTLTYSYSLSTVSSSSSSYRGGFAGYASGGTLSNCKYNSSAYSDSYATSTSLSTLQSTVSSITSGAVIDPSLTAVYEASSTSTKVNVSNVNELMEAIAANKDIRLTGDIDFAGIAYSTGYSTYSGTFDGNGYSILNLDTTYNYGGLFYSLNGATVKNLNIMNYTGDCAALTNDAYNSEIDNVHVIGGTITSGYQTGGLINYASSSKISNSSSSITINCNYSDGSTVGGLIGYADSSIIESCSASGTISVTNPESYYIDLDIGGLVGSNSGGSIKSSNSTTSITITGTCVSYYEDPYAYFNLGGLVAYNAGVISDSYSSGTLCYDVKPADDSNLSLATYIGGLVANNYGDISNSYSSSIISASGEGIQGAGGLVGNNSSNASIAHSYSTGGINITAEDANNIGGFVGYGQGIITNSYSLGVLNINKDNTNKNIGGFVGYQAGLFTDNYYNIENNTGLVGRFAGKVVALGQADILNAIENIDPTKEVTTATMTVSTAFELLSALQNNQDVKLAANIDLSDTTWSSIENYSGILDGNGFTISNLTHSDGLFKSTNNATIKNLTLENFNITNEYSPYYNEEFGVGALIGIAK